MQNFFKTTNDTLKPYGFTASFYNDSPKVKEVATTDAFELDTVEKLWTMHPSCNLKEVTPELRNLLLQEYGIRLGTSYAITRTNATGFLLRPNIKNVTSCHSLNPDQNAPGGNFQYLANGAWGCYFMHSGTHQSDLYHTVDVPVTNFDLPYGNVIASVNACIGYVQSMPAVLLSRVYGDDSKDWSRLVQHFNGLGFRVYVHEKWAGYLNVQSNYTRSSSARTFRSIPTESQLWLHGDKTHLVERYSDIPRMKVVEFAGKELLGEVHSCYLLEAKESVQSASQYCKALANDISDECWNTPCQPNKPTDAKVLRSWFEGLYENAHHLVSETLGMQNNRNDVQCSHCNDYCDEDETTYVSGYGTVCDSCLDSDFCYIDSIGEYVSTDDAVYSDVQERYIRDYDAVEFIADTFNTDHVEEQKIHRFDIVALDESCPVTGCDYAHVDYAVLATIYTVTNDRELQKDDDEVWLSCHDVDRNYVAITMGDEDVYLSNTDHELAISLGLIETPNGDNDGNVLDL